MDTRKYCENAGKPPRHVRHADLERSSPDSVYKSRCPACVEGYLLVRRNPKTIAIEAIDFCIACAQTFVYTDIDELRALPGSVV